MKYQLKRHILTDKVLYRRAHTFLFLICLDKYEADYMLREIHKGICGNHSGAKSMAFKTLRQGYFWPTLHQYAREKAKKWKNCQTSANYSSQALEKLMIMSLPQLFTQQGINLIGPLSKGQGGAIHAIVIIFYFTKWVENQKQSFTVAPQRTRQWTSYEETSSGDKEYHKLLSQLMGENLTL